MRGWTLVEEEQLRQLYPDTPTGMIAERLGRTVRAIHVKALKLGLRKNGHPGYSFPAHLRRYTLNVEAFAPLTAESAYVLGFIVADGSIIASRRLKISNTDLEILEKIRDVLGSSARICEARRSIYRWYELTLVNKQLVASLLAIGVSPRKSLIAALPEVPDGLFSHFLRGYFDGNGSARYGPRAGLVVKFTSGSKAILEQIAERTGHLFAVPHSPVVHDKDHPHAVRLYYCGLGALRLADAMYGNAGALFMPRKREPFERYRARLASG